VIACRVPKTASREISLSDNADNTTMILFTNNRKIGGFYNPRLFGTELRMTDQVEDISGSDIG
jgi:hypothetical protein